MLTHEAKVQIWCMWLIICLVSKIFTSQRDIETSKDRHFCAGLGGVLGLYLALVKRKT